MLALRLATRFLFFKRRETFISLNAVLAIGGVALSVLVLMVVVAVMSGFGTMLRDKIMSMTPHILIYHDRPMGNTDLVLRVLRAEPDCVAASPYVQGHAILSHDNRLHGVGIRGLALPEALTIVRLEQYLRLGRADMKRGEIVIGTELAKLLDVTLQDSVTILAAGGFDDENFPDELEFTIVGLFESGLHDYDLMQTFMSLKDAQLLYGFTHEVHGVDAAVLDPEKTAFVKRKLEPLLPTHLILRTWLESNKAFFKALKTEKNMMFILLGFAVLIASMNILSTQVMLVMEKVRDIGILKAIGLSRQRILQIFLLQGSLIGITGTAVGATLGFLFVHYIDIIETFVSRHTGYEVFPKDTYYFDRIPTDLGAMDVTIIIALAVTVSILAALYPAVKAARQNPVEAIRHE